MTGATTGSSKYDLPSLRLLFPEYIRRSASEDNNMHPSSSGTALDFTIGSTPAMPKSSSKPSEALPPRVLHARDSTEPSRLSDSGPSEEDTNSGPSEEDMEVVETFKRTRKRAKSKDAPKHTCTICAGSFNRPSSLATHMNTHTGAAPFCCPLPGCDRRFNVESNMRRHTRTWHAPPARDDGDNLHGGTAGRRVRRSKALNVAFFVEPYTALPPGPREQHWNELCSFD
uniref:C2H2-type domain-containing protein n=1 Tax=Mycena chlorophos TaxID=658473 RepID=A0ABQ0MAS4_MYCCL|nr:predicted protein [Mycena chlorophos]